MLYFVIIQILLTLPYGACEANLNTDVTKERRILLENDLDSRILKIEEQLLQIKQCVSQRSVGFTASLSAHKPSIGDHQIIDFDQVVTNIGNAFDPATSVFTAPYAGMYSFDLNIGTSSGTTDVEIVKNGTHLQRVYGASSGHWEVSSASVSTHLEKGDKVWVKQYTYNAGLVGHQLTSFNGFLVQPDCNLN